MGLEWNCGDANVDYIYTTETLAALLVFRLSSSPFSMDRLSELSIKLVVSTCIYTTRSRFSLCSSSKNSKIAAE